MKLANLGEKKNCFLFLRKKHCLDDMRKKNKKFKVITEIKTFIFSSKKQMPQKAKLVLQRSKVGHSKTSLALDYF